MRRTLAVAVLAALTGCPSAFAEPAVGTHSAGDGWIVRVSVEPSDLGPITVSVGRIRAVPANEAHVWRRHDIVFTNRGNRPVTFLGATTAAAFLGPPRRPVLLAADQGCGWVEAGKKRVGIGCLAYLDVLTVEPHRSVTRTVALFKGLRGLRPLAPGAYLFRKPIHFQAGRQIPEEGTAHTFTVKVVYEIDVR